MEHIKIIEATVCGGKNVKAGDVVKASDVDAHLLCNLGRAERVEAPEVSKKNKPSVPENPEDSKASGKGQEKQ